MIILFFLSLVLTLDNNLFAEDKKTPPPVDISFLVADIKYNHVDGVKICEVQNGTMSTFDGDIFCHGGRGTIVPAVVKWMESFGKTIWSVGFNIAEYSLHFEAKESASWIFKFSLSDIQKEKKFKQFAKKPPTNLKKISHYHSILFLTIPKKSERIKFMRKYPGAILLDHVTYPFWADKYLMSQLFNKDPLLRSAKPKWNLYDKTYTPKLAQTIINDLQCDRFVIKPRGECLGRGVILVKKKDLDATVKSILHKNRQLKKHPDETHQYWYRNEDDNFIVEEFIESDPLVVPHLNHKEYDPTMRVVYLLKYEEEKIALKFIGANWFMPSHSLDQSGTLSQKHKGFNQKPYYTLVDEEYLSEVRKSLDVIMRTLYWQMLIHDKT